MYIYLSCSSSIFKATDTKLFAGLLLQFAMGDLLLDFRSELDEYSMLTRQRAQDQWEGADRPGACPGAVGVTASRHCTGE